MSRNFVEGQKNLNLSEFYLDMDPPHDVFASCESMGFEIWLCKSSEFINFAFTLKMETSLNFVEYFNSPMHDVSTWLAQYVSSISEIEVLVFDDITQSHYTLQNGKIIASPVVRSA